MKGKRRKIKTKRNEDKGKEERERKATILQ